MAMTVKEAFNILTRHHGYNGPMTRKGISDFVNARDINIAVKMQQGGQTPTAEEIKEGQKKVLGQAILSPEQAVKQATVSQVDPEVGGVIIDPTTGQAPTPPVIDEVTKVPTDDVTTQAIPSTPVEKVDPMTSAGLMKELSETVKPAETTPTKEIVGQTQDTTKISDIDASQIDKATTVTPTTKRTLQEGEQIVGTGVYQTKVGEAFGTGEIKAASVQQELATLMSQFDDGKTPAWAAGSIRKATEILAARGMGASSMAGQAIVQAAMEAALPIAQIDAGNKQQMALVKAEQRAKFLQLEFDQAFQAKVRNAAIISEIANLNFTAEQQIALENAKMAQTVDLQNLNNNQAIIMAEAAQLSQLEMAGLTNLQQAQVQNAQNFLQTDMANLNNAQQVEIFKAQQQASAILSDVASQNSSQQFNATSANQTAQFDATMMNQVNQFNTSQKNAISQFNANEANAIARFNSELQNQRDVFNAQNATVIAQANAKWRQDITTLNTAAQNQVNFETAKNINGLTNKVLDEIWQRERDLMSYTFSSSEKALDRVSSLLAADKTLQGIRERVDSENSAARSNLFARMFFGMTGLPTFPFTNI